MGILIGGMDWSKKNSSVLTRPPRETSVLEAVKAIASGN
jgi:hypothetical protein